MEDVTPETYYDMEHGASHDTSSERQNDDQSLLQKISVNSELNLSWIDQIKELDNNGVEFVCLFVMI